MVNNIIEFENVSKQYREKAGEIVNALNPSELSIQAGEFFTLLGPSGCGKTTALRLMAGFIQPTAGNIKIDGLAMNNVPPYRRPVNTVFQNYALFPHMTIGENVAFGLEMKGVSKTERTARALQALELADFF